MVTDVFVGRRAELDELRSAADAATEGRGSLVLLAGEPGIGKTRLAELAADHARSAGLAVRWASCWEGSAPAFWPWVQLLRAHLDGHDDVPPEVRLLTGVAVPAGPAVLEGDAETARFALFDSVATFLRSESMRVPLMLVLDDLHWADVPSLRLLEFFASDLRGKAIVVVGTFRDVEVERGTDAGSALGRVCAAGDLFKLEGLKATEVAELLQTSTGSLASTDFTRTVHERTGGNPLFVRELGRLMAAQGRTESATLTVPEGVTGVIQRRLARLSQACHRFLATAAVFGNDFRIDYAADAAEIEVQRALDLVEEASTAKLVESSPSTVGRYAFAHALVRDALYDTIPLSRRADMHLAAAAAIERSGAADMHLAELAHHHLQALPRGSVDAAVTYSERAGRRALDQLAYEDAVSHFRHALDALELSADGDRRAGLLLELGDAQLRAGDMPGARTTFEKAADVARRRTRPDELARAALGFGAGLEGFEVQMADQPQIDLLEEAAKALGDDDSSLRARVLARLSVAVSYQESTERRRLLAEEGIEMARRVGDRRALAYALAAHCDAIAGPDHSERRVEEGKEIVTIARENGDRPLELLGRRLLVLAYLEMGDMASATDQVDGFARAAHALQQPLYAWFVPLWRGMRAVLYGVRDEALAYADEADAIGARAHSLNAPMLATVLRMVTAFFWEQLDDLKATADKTLESTGAYLEEGFADYYVGTIAAFRGEIGTAAAAIHRFAVNMLPRMAIDDAEWLPGACILAEGVAIVGDAEAAADLYERMLPYRARFAVEGIGAGVYGSVEHHLGLLARTCGRTADAEAHLEAALAANAALGGPLIVARTQREYARFLSERDRPGDRERADDLMAKAESVRRAHGVGGESGAEATTLGAVFRRDGEFWTLTFDGLVARMKDAKGLHDIAKLLAQPGREIAALDLATEVGAARRSAREDALESPGHAGELLDEQARAEYKERLSELEQDIAEAEELGDSIRAERARTERDAIAHELASAYGLGGRARKAGDPAERARTTVTRRIRDAIARVEEVHPALGRHLRSAVKTGTLCSYEPERSVDWEL